MACGTISGVRPTVLIVDDHAAFRASARALLQAEGFDVVGEATDGVEAVAAVAACGLRSSCSTSSCPGLMASRSPSSLPRRQTPP
jgi:CheY-like chemotaxis protein